MGVKTGWSPTNWAWDNLWERDLSRKPWNTVRETWYLGFTSFGGPPVHFKIVRCPVFLSAVVSTS